ncbi:hypothetical protein [Thalassolituus marinus]|uniref:Lipoprotein n=1 Tax=Thalassolituus marinus TaxID=671053 RepID=A0ABS7ZRZ5_9GAMM|nr:hypothetical protein [Thalassolituus marinus]MCA6064464.1 hypothetical protein [Thalassolituus marinus]
MEIIKLITVAITIFITGCASNSNYGITYNSEPQGAVLICNGENKGYTSKTLFYKLDKDDKKRGYFRTQTCEAKWVSGVRETYSNTWDLNKFPKGVMQTLQRPNVPGYQQDAEFALKVREMKAAERAANAAQQNSNNSVYQNTNTVNCKKMGEFLNVEIKTFSGAICPLGWIQAY